MATGTYLYLPAFTAFDDNGALVAGGKLYSYAAGTSTPQNTYSDVTLATPNANPVVLDASGRATIFLDPTLGYKFVLTDSTGTTLWTRDNFEPVPVTGVAATDNGIADGRLSLQSGSPVPSGNITGGGTIYYIPYKGNRIALSDGSAWNIYSFSQRQITIAAAVSTNYDVFAYYNTGTGLVTLEQVAWATNTTRTTALTYSDGVLVKSGDNTRRYLGTYRTDSSGLQTTNDTLTQRFVYNQDNRVLRPFFLTEASGATSWTYTTATWREANGRTDNIVELVCGGLVAEDELDLVLTGAAANTNANVECPVGIGFDSTVAPSSSAFLGSEVTQVVNQRVHQRSTFRIQPGIGYHFVAWLEFSAATGTTTWYGSVTSGSLVERSGLSGFWRC